MYKVRLAIFWVIVLFAIAVKSQVTCPQGSLPFSNSCVQLNYIEGCANYTKDGQCNICQYGYDKSGSACSYSSNKTENCCEAFAPTGQCLTCVLGLYLNGNICYSSNIPGCLVKQNGKCVNCANGFYSSNGVCLQKLPGCSQYQNGVCSVCNSGFILQGGCCISNESNQTLPPNCASSNEYICTSCNANYYLTKDGQCNPYGPGCLKYYREHCVACSNNFHLYNGSCQIEGCNTYVNSGCSVCKSPYILTNGVCKLDNCYHAVNGNCIICDDEYRLNGGKCVKPVQQTCQQCDTGYILGQDGFCYKQILGCMNYCSSGCSLCKTNFYLTNFTCVIPGCDKNSFSDSGCVNCLSPFISTSDDSCTVPYCQVITWQGCQRCQSGYNEEKGACISDNPNCTSYVRLDDQNEKCAQCVSPLILTATGDCVTPLPGCVYKNYQCISCLYPFIKDPTQTAQCWIPGCSKYNTNQCLICSSPYTLNNGSCTIDNCDQIGSNYLCSKCSNGYQLACKTWSCLPNVPYCSRYDNDTGICNQCVSGYTLNTLNNCVKLLPNCIQENIQGICTSCQTGYTLIQGQCIFTDVNCKVPLLQGCAQCNNGYHLQNGLCVINNVNCKSYSNILPVQCCQDCLDGYYLNEKHECHISIPGCTYKNDICISCIVPFTYNSNNNTCFINGCNKYCAQGCSVCASPFVLSNNICSINNCLLYSSSQCVKCNDGFTLDKTGCCEKEDSNCAQYDSSGNCKTCVSGYVVFQNVCVKQNKYCLQYSLTYGCNKCQNNYYLSNDNVCQLQLPGCIYQKGVCAFCQPPFQMEKKTQRCNIKGCSQMNSTCCVKCKSPFEMIQKTGQCAIPNCLTEKNGSCIRCSLGYHIKQGKKCVKDSPNCLTYNDDGDCQLCAKNYLLMSSGECELAVDNCINKSDDKIKCKACANGYILNAFRQCEKKDANCQQYNNGICSQCVPNYFLYQLICFAYSPGCVKYSGKDCVTCRKGYTLTNGECFSLKAPSLTMEGQNDNYNFQITPIDVTQSKYYIDNLSPCSSIGTLLYSSSYSSDYTKAELTDDSGTTTCKGWKAQKSKPNQFIGFMLQNQEPATFFAVQIENIQTYSVKQFYIEYTVDSTNYIRMSKPYQLTENNTDIQTIYFTGVYAQGIRIVISQFDVWPACRIQFFYYDYLRFQKISNLKSLKYLENTVDSNFVDRVDNQLDINTNYFFKPQTDCTNKDVCWTGLDLCQSKKIDSIRVFTGAAIGDQSSYLTQFYIMYSLDGSAFVCYQQCQNYSFPKQNYYDLTLNNLTAKSLRVYPGTYVGTPQFTVQYNYE